MVPPTTWISRSATTDFADGAGAFFSGEGIGELLLPYTGCAGITLAQAGESASAGRGETERASGQRVTDPNVVVEIGQRGDPIGMLRVALDAHR